MDPTDNQDDLMLELIRGSAGYVADPEFDEAENDGTQFLNLYIYALTTCINFQILFQASGSTKTKQKRGSKRKMVGCTTIMEIDKATGEPLAPGKIKTTFVNQLGYLVRESVPIKYKLWKRNKVSDRPEDIVPDSEKDLLWKEVSLHFTFPQAKLTK